MPNNDLLLLMMVGAFVVGAVYFYRNFQTYVVVVLVAITPLYGTEFMPREVLGITGLNFWNVLWLLAIAVIAPRFTKLKAGAGQTYFSPSIIIFTFVLLVATAYAMTEASAFPHFGPDAMSVTTILLSGWIKPMQILVLGWLVYAYCINVGDVRVVNRAVLAGGIVFAAAVVYFYFVGSLKTNYISDETYLTGRGMVSHAMGMHANDVGAWATYALVFSVLVKEQNRTWMLMRYATIAASLLTIVLSFSRTAFVAAPIALLLALPRVRWKERFVAVSIFVIIAVLMAPRIIERASFGLQSGKLDDISAGRTETIWGPLLKDVVERPILGNGRFAQLRSISYKKLRLAHAHSLYIQILLDMGIVGLAIVLTASMRLFQIGRKAKTMLPHLVFVMFLVGIAGHTFYPDIANHIVWVTYGISLATLALSRRAQNRVSPRAGGVLVSASGSTSPGQLVMRHAKPSHGTALR